jgi:molecular chaperone DnaJ
VLPRKIPFFSLVEFLAEMEGAKRRSLLLNELKNESIRLVAPEKAQQLGSLITEAGYLLSRIGNQIRVSELLQVTPFSTDQTEKLIKALVDCGAIEISGLERAAPLSAEGSLKKDEIPGEIQATLESDQRDPQLQALDTSFRQEILLKIQNLPHQKPFEILEIKNTASDHEVRQAYLRLSRKFHPDRFFRKPLGHYKRKLEQIFTAIQGAYESIKDPHDREALARQSQALSEKASSKNKDIGLTASSTKKIDPKLERMGKAEHLYKLGLAALKMKDYASAAQQFQLALQLQPDRPQYRKSYEELVPFLELHKAEHLLKEAEGSLTAGFSTEALEKAEQALRMMPESVQAKWIVGRAILESGESTRFKEALEMLQRAKAGMPKNPEPSILIAQIYYKRKDRDKAILELEEALRRDPQHAQAHRLLQKYSS